MRNLALASILAIAVLAVSGCSTKSACGCSAPSYPTCVAKPACGCK
jgi:hypothetical protein